MIGSNARTINACNALSKIVGIPRGLCSFEFGLGIQIRRIFSALYFLGLSIIILNLVIASALE
jgi:hypothetical protein